VSAPIPDDPAASAAGRWWPRLLKAGLTAAAGYLTWRLLAGIAWSELEARLVEARPLPLALAAVALLARFAAWDARFRLAARRVTGTSPGALLGFFVLLASAALNLLTPSARVIGGLVRARYVARANARPLGLFYGVVLFDQVAHHAVMIACTWLAIIVTAPARGRPGLGLGAAAALAAAFAGLAAWSRTRPRSMAPAGAAGAASAGPLARFLAARAALAEGRAQRLYAHGHEALGVFARLLADAPLRAPAVALGVAYFLLNAAAQWLVFAALGARVDPLVVVTAVAVGSAAGLAAGTPGGLGVTEATMMPLYSAMGVHAATGAAGTLLFRGLHYATILAVGLPALVVLELRGGKG
jgi:uncharacterized membrane protein YbhN (UPF0104 family)